MQAVDSASPHTTRSAQALAAGGYGFALRYQYNATRAEVDRLHAAGVGFSLIAEYDTLTWHPPLHSPETGARHGIDAVTVAARIGLPVGATIWFTADTFIGAKDYGRAATYWDGAASVVRRHGYLCGAYGGSKLIDWLIAGGHADRAWQCGAGSWNEGVMSQRAVLVQGGGGNVGGVAVDINYVTDLAGCGVWMPDGVTGAHTIEPTPATEAVPVPFSPHQPEDDMIVEVTMADGGRYEWNGVTATWVAPEADGGESDTILAIAAYCGLPIVATPAHPLNKASTRNFLRTFVLPSNPDALATFDVWAAAHPEVA